MHMGYYAYSVSLLLYLQNGDDVFLFHLEDFLARLVKTMFKEVFIRKITLSEHAKRPQNEALD